jgi:hypothetical protein
MNGDSYQTVDSLTSLRNRLQVRFLTLRGCFPGIIEGGTAPVDFKNILHFPYATASPRAPC